MPRAAHASLGVLILAALAVTSGGCGQTRYQGRLAPPTVTDYLTITREAGMVFQDQAILALGAIEEARNGRMTAQEARGKIASTLQAVSAARQRLERLQPAPAQDSEYRTLLREALNVEGTLAAAEQALAQGDLAAAAQLARRAVYLAQQTLPALVSH